jgi:hypothetical protein
VGKKPRLPFELPYEPPAQAMPTILRELQQRVEKEVEQKTQILLVLLGLVKSLGGEVEFQTDQGVVLQDKLHFRIEAGLTTLTYETAGGEPTPGPAPPGVAPPLPPRPRLWKPGDP